MLNTSYFRKSVERGVVKDEIGSFSNLVEWNSSVLPLQEPFWIAYRCVKAETQVNDFRIILEFMILRLTFYRKSASKCRIREIIIAYNSSSDYFRLSEHS